MNLNKIFASLVKKKQVVVRAEGKESALFCVLSILLIMLKNIIYKKSKYLSLIVNLRTNKQELYGSIATNASTKMI